MTKAAEWQADVGNAWASEWRRTDRSFAGLSPHLEAAVFAQARSTGRFIDLGCGAGETSLGIATARPDASVLGIDLSPGLIAVAKQRGADVGNLTFATGDAVALAAGAAPVDLFFSRHGVMFYDDPVAAFSQLRAAAADNATLVFSCFRALPLNPWASEMAVAINGAPPSPSAGYAPGPFAFADPAFVTGVLQASGWGAATHAPVDFRYVGGAGDDPVADALDFFQHIGPAAPALRAAAPDARPGMLARMQALLERHRTGDRVDFPAAAWLWTVKA